MDATSREFSFQGMPVGIFEESEYPRQDGRYRYMPYRSVGHSLMHTEIRENGSARCCFDTGSGQVSFTVTDCPEYGLLVLADFDAADDG